MSRIVCIAVASALALVLSVELWPADDDPLEGESPGGPKNYYGYCDAYDPMLSKVRVEKADVGGIEDHQAFPAAGYLTERPEPGGSFGQVVCGQTLIAKRVAVTAAHCVYNKRGSPLFVGFGRVPDPTDHNAANEDHEVRVVGIRIHPEFHPRLSFGDVPFKNDIALLQLQRDVPDIAPAVIRADGLLAGCPEAIDPCPVQIVSYGYGHDPNCNTRKMSTFAPVSAWRDDDGQAISVTARSVEGGVCGGDSGSGATIEGSNVLVGMTVGGSRSHPDTYCISVCTAERATFISLEGQERWIWQTADELMGPT